MSITDKTRSLLEAAGWFPERRVDVTETIVTIQTEGYGIWASAQEFLERFSGLHVKVPHPKHRWRFLCAIHPSEATGFFDREEILLAEQQLGEALTPVGSYQSCCGVFMGTSGAFYAITDNIMIRLGRDWEEALNAMCLEGETERLPDWR